MATQSGRANAAVATLPDEGVFALLRVAPWRFTFYQAVRLLLSRRIAVRFRAHPALDFPASEIQALTFSADGKQAELTVNFMGLTGPAGVLPQVWTEQVIRQNQSGEPSFGDFIDIFNSLYIWLYYAAWEKYRFAFAVERGQQDTPFVEVLRSLIGIGLPELQQRAGQEFTADGSPVLQDAALVWYTGILSLQVRSAGALEQLLSDYFGVPVELEQFVPVWRTLEPEQQCLLDDGFSESAQLGFGAVAGDEVLDASSRVRIRIGPLSRGQYRKFLPGGSAWAPLRTLVRLFSNELEFEVQLILAKDRVPGCRIGTGDSRLGWMTWMSQPLREEDACDTILPLSPAFNAAQG